jgi:hypothetical protein
MEGKHEEALELARRLRASHPGFRRPMSGSSSRARWKARTAGRGAGRVRRARRHLPGEEGRWRYGALLKRLGRDADAQAVFLRMLRTPSASRRTTATRSATG